MSETRNIVILGASFGGLSAAHYIARHTLPKLAQSKDVKYEVHIVDPSTHFWWHIAAPREMVSTTALTHKQCFIPTMDGFKQYSNVKDSFIFHHGEATGVNTESRTVTLKAHGSESVETLHYYSLIIATGVRSPTPLTTLHGDHTISQKALEAMNKKLASAKEIVIGGGGPVAVESAGEIGTKYGGKAKITLVAGGKKLLPVLRQSLSDKASKQLSKVGVKVLYSVKVSGADETGDGKTNVKLDNGESILADVYIPAVGVKPSAQFLPANLKTDAGFVKTNPITLRVDAAGPRVYCVGDVGGYDKGGVLNLYAAMPIFGANFNHDIFGSGPEKSYKSSNGETQLVPVGPKTGVGAFNGWQMPGFAVAMVKGKDYMVSQMDAITEGKKYAKA